MSLIQELRKDGVFSIAIKPMGEKSSTCSPVRLRSRPDESFCQGPPTWLDGIRSDLPAFPLGVWGRVFEAISAAYVGMPAMFGGKKKVAETAGVARSDAVCMRRSRGGLTHKIDAVVNANDLPVKRKLTPGMADDGRSAADMLDGIGSGQALLADAALQIAFERGRAVLPPHQALPRDRHTVGETRREPSRPHQTRRNKAMDRK